MGNTKIRGGKVLVLAGAIIAFTIGSGFATGQEIMQYYTAYGPFMILAVIAFAAMFLYYNFNFAKAGAEETFERSNDIFRFYCGKYIGTFFDYYSTVFAYMSFWVMVGGASSTLNQQYGMPMWVGASILLVITVGTVVLGLEKLVDAIGVIGPVIVVVCIGVAVVTLVNSIGNLPEGFQIVMSGALEGDTAGEGMKNAGANWFLSAYSYAGFVLLWFASFTSALGMKNKKAELNWGIVLGTVAVCVAIILVSLAQICNINLQSLDGTSYVWNAAIPNLLLAENIWPPIASVYAIIVFLGIYTTAVPLLFNPASRFATEGTMKYRLLTVGLGVIGMAVGLFVPFRTLVNFIYVLNGYLGGALLVFMLVRNITDLIGRKSGKNPLAFFYGEYAAVPASASIFKEIKGEVHVNAGDSLQSVRMERTRTEREAYETEEREYKQFREEYWSLGVLTERLETTSQNLEKTTEQLNEMSKRLEEISVFLQERTYAAYESDQYDKPRFGGGEAHHASEGAPCAEACEDAVGAAAEK